MNDIQLGVITLIKSAVTGEKLALPNGFSLGEALRVLKKHGIQAMGYIGAVNCGIPKSDPIMQGLFQFYCRSVVFSQRQLDKINQLFDAFENNGIDYMPLKGTILKHLYPSHELRPMGDADILIRVEQYDRIKPVMESLDYTSEEENGHELPWRCQELYVELHKCLIPDSNVDLHAYYGDGWNRATKENGCRYQMTAEDQFVFLFTHFVKHFRGGGIGCRHVTDLWVFQQKHPAMDQAYIQHQMNSIHLLEFYDNMHALLSCWFTQGQWNEKTEFISEFIFNSGIWGERKSHDLAANARFVEKSGNVEKGKWRHFLSRVFPSSTYVGYQFPVVKKVPILLPVFWVVRWVNIAIHKPDTMKRRFQMLDSSNNNEILTWQKNMDYVGLGRTPNS